MTMKLRFEIDAGALGASTAEPMGMSSWQATPVVADVYRGHRERAAEVEVELVVGAEVDDVVRGVRLQSDPAIAVQRALHDVRRHLAARRRRRRAAAGAVLHGGGAREVGEQEARVGHASPPARETART